MTALCGCVDFAPPYQRPPAPVAAAWPQPPATAASTAPDPADIGWTGFIQDDRLRQVVRLAIDNNRDLRVALLRVQDARAQYRVQDAARLPVVALDAGVTRSTTSGVVTRSATVGLGLAAYEIDLFSRVRNATDAALHRYFATDEGARVARIVLVAAVASAWLTLRADGDNQRLNLETLALDARSLELNTRLHELGAIAALPVAQAQAAWQAARGAVAAGRATLQQDRDALVLLAGADVPEPWLPLDAAPGDPTALVDVPPGLPASVLQQRPDVRAAEHELEAAQLEIGIARAAYFPTVSLSASAGRVSTGLAGLLKTGAASWSLGPSVSLPLLDGGGLAAGLESARSRRGIALASYDKALQAAFAEVADVLAVRSTLAERLDAQAAQLRASETAWHNADTLYRHGATSYLQVLDAQRSLQAARQAGIALNLMEQQNRIALYKALGGGWKESN
jgi:outer membrane protein, multidrug efflux system